MKRSIFSAVVVLSVFAFGALARDLPRELESSARLMIEGRWDKAASICEEYVRKNPRHPQAWFQLAHARYGGADYAGAIKAGRRATEFAAVRAPAYYNLACAYALSDRADEALDALEQARRAGFEDRELMSKDPDLASIRDDPRFALPEARLFFDLELPGGRTLPYSVDLPLDFDPERAYPVLVGPGAGEPGSGREESPYWGEESANRGWIAVESTSWTGDDPAETTARLFDEIERRYQVEGGKFHVAGFGEAGTGAFEIALAMPERVHSVTGLPGHPRSASDEEVTGLAGVKVSFLVGEKDGSILERSKEFHERFSQSGIDTRLAVIEGGERVLEELYGGEFMDWLDERVRSE